MDRDVAVIGFGEAAQAFFGDRSARSIRMRAYDRKTDDAGTLATKQDEYDRAGIAGTLTLSEALTGANSIFSLVTADQALAAAEASARFLAPGAFFFDMNSVAPQTKQAASRAIETVGGHYVDAAVMAPALPARMAVPLLLSGPAAEQGASLLRALGFSSVDVLPGAVGRSSCVKMIRSVMVKGLEALTAECVLAADTAGVLEEVLASLDASPPPQAWAARADYNLGRMMQHGIRRANEMEEVAKTLGALDAGAETTACTIAWQRRIGGRGISPPAGLAAKLLALRSTGPRLMGAKRAAA